MDSSCSARIADFGLTSLLRHPSVSISVSTPAWGGTSQWMAPELFDGESRPSPESDIYALGMVIYEVCTLHAWRIRSEISPSQVLAHRRPFSPVLLILAGRRPSRPTNHDILGLSADVWVLMEGCWDLNPSVRPHIADILKLFETASCGWVSPTSEAIAGLGLGRPTGQNSPMTESADTISETAFDMICGGAGPCGAGQSPPTSNR